MTIEPDQPARNGPGHDTLEADILALLWEHAPFPRLPLDAPSEIKDLTVNVENPKRVYTVHRAYRRHNLQLLVEKFVYQLRYGCGRQDCTTASCFSCRRRLAGKAPIRRYSPTSARTLAIYLANQDNPESRLCPFLQPPSWPSDAIKPLVFGASYTASSHDTTKHASLKKRPGARQQRAQPRSPVRQGGQCGSAQNDERDSKSTDTRADIHPTEVAATLRIIEKPTSKDYRSFAANVFGTVAFKMMEWLTPNGIEAMTDKLKPVAGSSRTAHASRLDLPSIDDGEEDLVVSAAPAPRAPDRPFKTNGANVADGPTSDQNLNGATIESSHTTNPEKSFAPDVPDHRRHPSHSKKRSNARIRTSSGSKSQAKVTSESLVESATDDAGLKSPKLKSAQPEKVTKGLIRPPSIVRTASQLSTDNLLDVISDEPVPVPECLESSINGNQSQLDGVNGEVASSSEDTPGSVDTPRGNQDATVPSDLKESASELDNYLPQSLSRLNVPAVNFLCDVLQDDATGERHMLKPPFVNGHLKCTTKRQKFWKRRRSHRRPYPQNLKLEWKIFAEQSIFNVLSDPQAVLESFAGRDGSIDSQALWYCMLRLTRVAPSLVFDSLWTALAGVYAPPRPLQSCKSTVKTLAKSQKAFSNAEAASLMSVCFHALVAAAPLVTEARQLNDMSRIRAHGLTLTGSGAVAMQPASLCLQYEDAFTDDMALRLARRLLTAIPARRYFDDLLAHDLAFDEGMAEPDVVDILLSHIEPSSQSSIPFSKAEQNLHEKRIPVLLLDWARAVMIQEWQGKPEVCGDGPIGGALALIAAMYEKRQSLLLGDVNFRSEYFGERLDSIETPVSWLTFNSTKQKVHLLDYPFIFNPTSLVSYFRAINFCRMNRSYEESTSLQSRIDAFINLPDALVTEAHQKNILQDLLKTASTKYLILDIGRHNVLMDAFDQLWRREERELMRPLKVHLGEDSGEEGFDSGGVQQEFFRLAIAEALDPTYGAFTIDDRTRMTWFQPGSLQPEWKFELIGLLMSLAIYNGLTLPITFPKALYRKLLGEPVTELHHIADGWPEIASGLTNLLEWNERDGAVEDVFVLTYEFSADMFGQPVSRHMDTTAPPSWPQFSPHPDAAPLTAANPPDAPAVTGDNRLAYVADYIRYLTDVSVGPQFAAFARGFNTCLHPKSLSLLSPALLQNIVEGAGGADIDVAELRRAARYVGWDATHRSVRDFWSIVRAFDNRMRRRLLEFVTASDRVPVGGVQNIQFVVQRNGQEEGPNGHLPTAYTCYGTLLLPEYPNKKVMHERLSMALENAQGFGFA
ncbi:hypothetical protein F4780DRAFT_7064 [Xylariomycetidae sp. FL0641]|nr:hypothetical protein F4780DRAFT_7064 [Xylariomycetidae sp. FL0641]